MSRCLRNLTALFILIATLLFTVSLQAEDKLILPTLDPVPTEIIPNYGKPGGYPLGPAIPRAFLYGGRHAVRDLNGLLHVTWEDHTYQFHYYTHSLDSFGLSWADPINPMAEVGFTVERALMAKMAIDPVTGYLYMLPFYRVNPEEEYKTGITRSIDNGETWSMYMDLGNKLGITDEELSWGTFAIGDDQVLRIAVTLENSFILYTQADLPGNSNLDNLVFTQADGITTGADSITVASGVIFQGTIVLDRNNDPHIIFSGDGDARTFGDKTPYHIYYKSDASVWGPNPSLQLMSELEQTWGMPELVFDANNRGYYFLDLNPGNFIFGTWIPPASDTSTIDFGIWNNTGNVNGIDTTVILTNNNFPNLNIFSADKLYLPNADVDDVNDVIYLVGNTNGYSSGQGGDIVIIALENATQYPDTSYLTDFDWNIQRWITSDGIGLGDVGADMIYDPASSTTDIFYSGAGYTSNVAYFGAWGPIGLCIDIQAYSVSFINTRSDKIFVNENDEITIVGVVKNNGVCPLIPAQVTVTIQNSDGDTMFITDSTIQPLPSGALTPELEFGPWTVQGAGQRFNIILSVIIPGEEATYNNQISANFFAYPNPDNAYGWDSFQDSNYTNFPTFLTDGSQFINEGNWSPANASTGGWTVVDSTHDGSFGYINTWLLYNDRNSNEFAAYIRHCQGIENDSLYYHIYFCGELAQPQNELLYSPWYDIEGAEIVTLEWDDDIDGTAGENNYPIYAFVDVLTDGGTTWEPVYHRIDSTGVGGVISGSRSFLQYDLSEIISGADSIQVRFWWRNPNNDGSYATWEIDNVYLMNRTTVGTETITILLPKDFMLYQNYPNPFNPVTTIRYSVPETGHLSLKVYDILGREVMTLIDGVVTAGNQQVRFDATQLTTGIYFYRLKTLNRQITKKMLVMK